MEIRGLMAYSMETEVEKLSGFRSAYEAHSTHIPNLTKIVFEMDRLVTSLIPKVRTLPPFLKANIDFNLYALADLNKSLIGMLEDNRICSAEALSRVSCEQAVNLAFVIEGASDERAKLLIQDYFLHAKKKVRDWKSYANSHKYDNVSRVAEQRLNNLTEWEKRLDINQYKNLSWPSAIHRFRSVGVEDCYHNVFAPASGSIHGFQEDIFNSTLLYFYPTEMRAYAFKVNIAEKNSFAIYLALNAIALYIGAIHSLAIELEVLSVAKELEGMGEAVNSMIIAHEIVSKEFLSDVHYEQAVAFGSGVD